MDKFLHRGGISTQDNSAYGSKHNHGLNTTNILTLHANVLKYSSWGKTNVHIPTFFFLLHVNVWGSIPVPFQNTLSQHLFPVTSDTLFILPLVGPNMVTMSHRRAVRLTHLDISSETREKALNVASRSNLQEISLLPRRGKCLCNSLCSSVICTFLT